MNTAMLMAALAAMLSGCGRQATTITDVTVPQTVILQKQPSQKSIYKITIQGSGTIAGTAKLSLLLDGKPYWETSLSGTIDFEREHDWYADQAELRFEPGTDTAGTIRLRYRFWD